MNVSLSGHLLLRLPLFCESYINGEFGLLILRESLLVPQKKNNEIMIIIMKGVPEVQKMTILHHNLILINILSSLTA